MLPKVTCTRCFFPPFSPSTCRAILHHTNNKINGFMSAVIKWRILSIGQHGDWKANTLQTNNATHVSFHLVVKVLASSAIKTPTHRRCQSFVCVLALEALGKTKWSFQREAQASKVQNGKPFSSHYHSQKKIGKWTIFFAVRAEFLLKKLSFSFLNFGSKVESSLDRLFSS